MFKALDTRHVLCLHDRGHVLVSLLINRASSLDRHITETEIIKTFWEFWSPKYFFKTFILQVFHFILNIHIEVNSPTAFQCLRLVSHNFTIKYRYYLYSLVNPQIMVMLFVNNRLNITRAAMVRLVVLVSILLSHDKNKSCHQN